MIKLTALIAGLFLVGTGTGIGHAALILNTTNQDFSTRPALINLGLASYTFSAIPGALPGDPPAAVATSGTAKVSSFFGGVADFGDGASIDQTGELYGFSAFPTATTIPNSAALDFIGLAFTLHDGLHYGYAEVAGTDLVRYAYQSTPGVGVVTSVPEPAAILLFGVGLTGLGLLLRRGRTRTTLADG